MNTTTKQVIENQIKQLEENNEFLSRQIEVKAQRLEDLIELKETLNPPSPLQVDDTNSEYTVTEQTIRKYQKS